MSIELHIERLVIDEAVLGGERASSVRVALERELTQALSHPGAIRALSGMGSVTSLPACGMPDAKHVGTSLGERIAAAVGKGLGAGAVAPASDRTARPGGRHG
ncbi:hypothetical protein [Dyella jiangningensis]|uniref:Uncharacterized protein n=1 Tax=Dyella jiangningensis TaxID=1379159 RepID=A0A328PA64_9GAMM|nr:hypothetical protein [Dyella jiangningensis]RAO78101.1 hypothetical protein CA260_09825 [Dyella jiangningensis]